MLGASNKVDSIVQYLEQPVNKLLILVKNNESRVPFPDREPKIEDVLGIFRGVIC